MPLLTFCVLFYILYLLFFNKTIKNIYFSILCIYVFIVSENINCVVFLGGENGIGSLEGILRYLLFIFSIILIIKNRSSLKKRIILKCLCFLAIVVIGLLYEKLFPYDGLVLSDQARVESSPWDEFVLGLTSPIPPIVDLGESIRLFIIVLIFCSNIIVIKTFFKKYDFSLFIDKFLFWGNIYLFFGVVEYVLKNVINMPNLYMGLSYIFLGTKGLFKEPVLRDGAFVLQGLCAEPSHYTTGLFILLCIMILNFKIKSVYEYKFIISFVIYLFLMINTGAFSMLLYLALVFIIGVIVYFNMSNCNAKKIFKVFFTMLFLGTFLLGFIFLFLSNNQDSFISDKFASLMTIIDYFYNGVMTIPLDLTGVSNYARMLSIFMTMEGFFNRPLLGLGIGVQYAHDIVVTMLSSYGLIGVIVWFLCISDKNNMEKSYDFVFFFFFFWFAGFFDGLRYRELTNYIYVIALEFSCLYMQDEYNQSNNWKGKKWVNEIME